MYEEIHSFEDNIEFDERRYKNSSGEDIYTLQYVKNRNPENDTENDSLAPIIFQDVRNNKTINLKIEYDSEQDPDL